MMKNILTFIIVVVALSVVSCEKDNVQKEMPGNIPGLGDVPGTPEVTEKFVLPDGIRIHGAITGLAGAEQTVVSLKSSSGAKLEIPEYGSGEDVVLKVTLQNTSSIKRTVFFPKGLIWECTTGDYQHGLQVQTTWVCLSPNQTKTMIIHLYCANFGLSRPDHNGNYVILGVTSSKVLQKFLSLIRWRMVNYEMTAGNSSLKSANVGPSYDQIAERLQTIVHNLTDRGIELTEEDVLFIESIPELPIEDRPQLDENGNYPVYFEEYFVSAE